MMLLSSCHFHFPFLSFPFIQSKIPRIISKISFTDGLISYVIPKGVQRGNEVELSDKTYDGEDEGDRLVGGLGQLADGQKGMDNFRSDHGLGKGKSVITSCNKIGFCFLI